MLSRMFPAMRLLDMPNVLTIMNALLAVVAIGAASYGYLHACGTLIFFAAMLDYLDGHVARQYFSASAQRREFGKQLDTLADLLNFSVAPAVCVLECVSHSILAWSICAALVLSSVLRLALFNILSESRPGAYLGIPTTFSGFAMACVLFLFASHRISEAAVLVVVATLAVLQISNLEVRKPRTGVVTTAMGTIFLATAVWATHF